MVSQDLPCLFCDSAVFVDFVFAKWNNKSIHIARHSRFLRGCVRCGGLNFFGHHRVSAYLIDFTNPNKRIDYSNKVNDSEWRYGRICEPGRIRPSGRTSDNEGSAWVLQPSRFNAFAPWEYHPAFSNSEEMCQTIIKQRATLENQIRVFMKWNEINGKRTSHRLKTLWPFGGVPKGSSERRVSLGC
jgi:hypothetical protein